MNDSLWAYKRCLRIWICGYSTSLMSVRELWSIVFHPTVIAICAIVGSAAGVSTAFAMMALGDEGYYFMLAFCIIPQIITTLAALCSTSLVYFRHKFSRSGNVDLVISPSFPIVLLAAIAVIAPVYAAKLRVSGEGPIIYWIEITAYPLAYTIISDFFHYIVFRYLAPSIWQRPHVFHEQDDANRADLNVVQAMDPPEPQQPFKIGKTEVTKADVLFLEAQGNYLRVVTRDVDRLERFRISEAVELIGEEIGVFLHRSRWIAFSAITQVTRCGGQSSVEALNGEALTIASTREKEVLDAVKARRIEIKKAR